MTLEERYRPDEETYLMVVKTRRQCMTCGACIWVTDDTQLELHHKWHTDMEEKFAKVVAKHA
jgi:5-methylcytosine-specific restriction endonuclease McrA